MEYGIRNVKIAENTKKLTKSIGIIHADGSMVSYVKNVISKNQSQLGIYSFQKAGNVKLINQKNERPEIIIHEPTKVLQA